MFAITVGKGKFTMSCLTSSMRIMRVFYQISPFSLEDDIPGICSAEI